MSKTQIPGEVVRAEACKIESPGETGGLADS